MSLDGAEVTGVGALYSVALVELAIPGSLEHPEVLRPLVNQPCLLAGLRRLAVPASVCATPGPP